MKLKTVWILQLFQRFYLCDTKSNADSTNPHQIFQQEELDSRGATLRRSSHMRYCIICTHEEKQKRKERERSLKCVFPADLCVDVGLVMSTTLTLHHAAGIWHGIMVFPAYAGGPVIRAVCATAFKL